MYTIEIYQQVHNARCWISSPINHADLSFVPVTKCFSLSSALPLLSYTFDFLDSTIGQEHFFFWSGLFQLSLPPIIAYMYCKWRDLSLLLRCSYPFPISLQVSYSFLLLPSSLQSFILLPSSLLSIPLLSPSFLSFSPPLSRLPIPFLLFLQVSYPFPPPPSKSPILSPFFFLFFSSSFFWQSLTALISILLNL